MREVDVALVGAGGAGLSVLTGLDRLVTAARAVGRDVAVPSIVLVDPVSHAGQDRTWCFWDDGGSSDVEACVHRAWRRVELRGRDGRAHLLDLAPMRYVMVRSGDFYAFADAAAARLGAARIVAGVDAVRDGEDRAYLLTASGEVIAARWVLDSRPAPPARPARTSWLQHFRGWTVRFGEDVVDPDVPVLMDFAPPQPDRGVAFGYVLPLDARRALVEYTEFSPARLPGPAYEAALRAYLSARWGARVARSVRIEAVEDGAIPMTDAVHARRAGRRVFRIGTAGGATRPSTGYTFAALQRQGAAVAAALLAGREPLPPRPYPARHQWMDAVLLAGLDRGYICGADLLTHLFDANAPQRVLRFLDGASTPAEELALMRTAPTAAMTRASAADAVARLRGAALGGGWTVRRWQDRAAGAVTGLSPGQPTAGPPTRGP